MFSLLGTKHNLKNICLLSSPYIDIKTVKNSNELKPAFSQFLSSHQPQTGAAIVANQIFVQESERSALLKNAYRASSLNDRNQNDLIKEDIEGTELERFIHQTEAGLDYLTSCNPDVRSIFDLAIHSIFFRRSGSSSDGKKSFGGSSSTAIGAIWISGLKDLRPCDIGEFLLHELTHHLLFIDERCRKQFAYTEMIKPENYAQSAILHKKRPLDKVVHSIIVATEILLARKTFLKSPGLLVHPDSETLKRQTLNSISSVMELNNLDDVLTPWTIELILKSEQSINLKCEAIA
jgi:hypothetical protein